MYFSLWATMRILPILERFQLRLSALGKGLKALWSSFLTLILGTSGGRVQSVAMRVILMLGLSLYSSVLALISVGASLMATRVDLVLGVASGLFAGSLLTLVLIVAILIIVKRTRASN